VLLRTFVTKTTLHLVPIGVFQYHSLYAQLHKFADNTQIVRRNTELTCNELNYEIVHCQTIVILINAYRNRYIVVQGGKPILRS
jgi:hypothetical protein